MRIADANLEIESDDGSCLPEEICFDVCTLGDQELVHQLTKDYFKLDSEKVDKIFAEGQKNGNLCVINLYLCYKVDRNFVGGWGDFHEAGEDSELDGFDLAEAFDNPEDQNYLLSLISMYCWKNHGKSLNEYIRQG